MHYYQHSIGDYRRDTMHLTLLEHGVYRQLLDLYYLNECELNANALRLICARNADDMQAAESVLNEFFVKTETGYKHKRCDDEIARFHEKSLKAKSSADARWQGKSQSKNNQNANAMRTQCEGNANHKPLTINHIKGSRLNQDWILPKEWIDEAKKINGSLSSERIVFIADGFKDYWIGVAGSKGIKLNWLATWRNWIRNQKNEKVDAQKEKLKMEFI